MKHLNNIQADIDWLSKIIEERIKDINFIFESIKPVKLNPECAYSEFITSNIKENSERLLLILTLVPNIYPALLYDKFNSRYAKECNSRKYFVECPKYYSSIIKSSGSESFLPTGQTFLYLAAGNNLKDRIKLISCIYEELYYTISNNIISPVQNNLYDPILSNILTIKQNYALSFSTNNPKYLQLNNQYERI